MAQDIESAGIKSMKQLIHNWNNAPWTARGLRFKTAVEYVALWATLIVILGLSGMWQ